MKSLESYKCKKFKSKGFLSLISICLTKTARVSIYREIEIHRTSLAVTNIIIKLLHTLLYASASDLQISIIIVQT